MARKRRRIWLRTTAPPSRRLIAYATSTRVLSGSPATKRTRSGPLWPRADGVANRANRRRVWTRPGTSIRPSAGGGPLPAGTSGPRDRPGCACAPGIRGFSPFFAYWAGTYASLNPHLKVFHGDRIAPWGLSALLAGNLTPPAEAPGRAPPRGVQFLSPPWRGLSSRIGLWIMSESICGGDS